MTSRRPDDATRIIAKTQRSLSEYALKGHQHSFDGSVVDFDSTVDGANLALSGVFQTAATLAYTPPAGWSEYKIQGDVSVMAAGLTSGDNVQLLAQVGVSTGDLVTENAASTSRFVVAYIELGGLSGAINLEARVRNTTAARGTSYTAWVRLTAVRTG